jgi:hypothetical protein
MKRGNEITTFPAACRAACWALRAGALSALVALSMAATATYPNEYRAWIHVKSAMITRAHPAAESEGGLHHIYANAKAAEGYRTGRFADGAAIVYELLETTEKDGVISESGRRRLDVMFKDSARYRESGGWGYQRFLGTNETENVLDARNEAQCHQCHSRASAHGFVFSRMR